MKKELQIQAGSMYQERTVLIDLLEQYKEKTLEKLITHCDRLEVKNCAYETDSLVLIDEKCFVYKNKNLYLTAEC